MAIDHKEILNDVENQIRGLAQAAAAQPKALSIDPVVIARPTQADLEAVVNGKAAAAAADGAWDDPAELEIHALLHRAWALEVTRKGWSVGDIASIHVKSLRMAQAAIRLIPKREGNV